MTDVILNEWFTTSIDKFKTILPETPDQSAEVIIAKDEDNKGGILGLCSFEKRTKNNESYVYINLLAVNKTTRQRGIGTALLLHAISAFKDVIKCQLTTLAYANDAVHAFYERRGFVNCGITTIDPRTPDTHLLYRLVIEKKSSQ